MISPRRYAQQVKQDIIPNITRESADMVLTRLSREPDLPVRIVGDIPRCISVKYHKFLSDILVTLYVAAILKKTSYEFSLRQKHEILNTVLKYTGNVRES